MTPRGTPPRNSDTNHKLRRTFSCTRPAGSGLSLLCLVLRVPGPLGKTVSRKSSSSSSDPLTFLLVISRPACHQVAVAQPRQHSLLLLPWTPRQHPKVQMKQARTPTTPALSVVNQQCPSEDVDCHPAVAQNARAKAAVGTNNTQMQVSLISRKTGCSGRITRKSKPRHATANPLTLWCWRRENVNSSNKSAVHIMSLPSATKDHNKFLAGPKCVV